MKVFRLNSRYLPIEPDKGFFSSNLLILTGSVALSLIMQFFIYNIFNTLWANFSLNRISYKENDETENNYGDNLS